MRAVRAGGLFQQSDGDQAAMWAFATSVTRGLWPKPVCPNSVAQAMGVWAGAARRGEAAGPHEVTAIVEQRLAKIAMQMAEDGTSPAVIEDTLRSEIERWSVRCDRRRRMAAAVVRYVPAGMMVCVLGLFLVGPCRFAGVEAGPLVLAAAVAMLVAEGMWLAWHDRASHCRYAETLAGELVLCGVLASLAGDETLIVQQKLASFFGTQNEPSLNHV